MALLSLVSGSWVRPWMVAFTSRHWFCPAHGPHIKTSSVICSAEYCPQAGKAPAPCSSGSLPLPTPSPPSRRIPSQCWGVGLTWWEDGCEVTDRCCPSATEPGQLHSPLAHSSVSPCSEPRVSQFIKKYVASCLLISDTNTELSYILPSEAVKKGCFERLFLVPVGTGGGGQAGGCRVLWHCGHLLPSSCSALPPQHLEQSLEELDLTSFGLMDTTLEEVFLKVSEEDQSLENSDVGTGSGGTCGGAGAGTCVFAWAR